MKASGPKHERETIINFNEEEDKATIWTASEITYRRLLKRLGRAYLTEEGERHAVFSFPRQWLILPRFKTKRPANPTQRSNLATCVAASREKQGGKTINKGIPVT